MLALKIITVTFRKYGLSIKGYLYSYDKNEKKLKAPTKEAIERIKSLVEGSITFTMELFHKGNTYAFTGRFSSFNARKQVVVVFYVPYSLSHKNTVESFITNVFTKHIGTKRGTLSSVLLFHLKTFNRVRDFKALNSKKD